jgi:PleD family two-component response regulator
MLNVKTRVVCLSAICHFTFRPASFSSLLAVAARILIVDDEPNIIGAVSPLLRARGHDVLSAMTGRAALETIDRDKPDLIARSELAGYRWRRGVPPGYGRR